LDYFAGSGTTAHAVIDLNRKDGGRRKYILVEMGHYFDTVLVPRIKKVIYSKDWKNGKPVSRDGVSHMFKYIRLESYEDALANIEIQRTEPQQLLLDKAGDFRESYMLKYMFDVESRGSQTLLNIDNFDDPWNYKLLVGAGSVGETRPVNVDLVETFNWLLGLKVKHIDRISGFQVIEGENPEGEKVLVIWRKVRDLDETDFDKIAAAREQANRNLEAFFRKQQYNTLDSEFDVIYVNGDNNLMNVSLDPDKEGVEPRYKVRLIEEEFKRLMFDVVEM
jgi:adenine-specific DNA-methyltransferase